MNCTEARLLLTRGLREALPESARAALDRHLGGCPGCRREREELERVDGLLAGAGRRDIITPRVDTRAILAARSAGRPWLPVLALSGIVVAAAAAVTFMIIPGPKPVAHAPAAPPHRELPREEAPAPALAPRPSLRADPGRPHGTKPRLARRPEPPRPFPRRQVARRATPSKRAPAEILRVPALQSAESLRPVALRPEREAIAAAFRGDAALAKEVVLGARDRPLGEVLSEWGRQLGVRMGASRSTADDRVTLLTGKRPAAESLTRLARHFGFQWVRSAGAYELTQDLASQRNEEELRRAELRPIQEQIELTERLLKLTPEQHKARVQEIELRERAADATPEEKARLAAEKQNVLNAWLGPDVIRASLALFRTLSPAQISALLGGTDLHFSSATGTLPPPIAERIHDSTSVLEARNGPLPRLQADATIRLTDVEDEDQVPPPRKGRQFRLRFQYTTLRGSKQDLRSWGSSWSPSLPEPPQPDPAPDELRDPVLNQVVELKLPGPDQPHAFIQGGGLIGAALVGGAWPDWPTVGDLAAELHRTCGLDVVADSFTGARMDPYLLRGKRKVGEILQIMARELDYTWKKNGNLLQLRSRRYFAERPAEVPARVTRTLPARVAAEGRLTLDSLAALAATVDDPQARSLFRYWGWYLPGILPTDYFYPRRDHLRFWASLTPAQRKGLAAGETLAVAAMTPVQRRLWERAFTAAPESARTAASSLRQPNPAEVAAGGFSLTTAEVQYLIWVRNTPDPLRRVANGLYAEGPASLDIRQFMRFENGERPEPAAPQASLDGYTFHFYLGGDGDPARSDRILIPRPQKARPRERTDR